MKPNECNWLRRRTIRKASLPAILFLGIATFVLGMVILGHAQTQRRTGRYTQHPTEFAVSNSGFSWRVEPTGSLVSPSDARASSLFPYAYDFRLLQVSPDGYSVYIGGQQFLTHDDKGKGFLEAFSLSPQGRLQLVGTFAQGISDNYPYGLAFGARGRFIYVLTAHAAPGHGFSALSSYRIGRGGRITKLSIPERRVGTAPIRQGDKVFQPDIISDPQGRFVYITQPQGHTVLQYRVTANGSLKPLGFNALSLPQIPSHLLFPQGGSFLYVTSTNDDSLTQLTVGPDGRLRVAHFFRFGNVKRTIDPVLAITPNGRFLYVGDDMRPVTQQYAIQPSGALKPLSPPTAAFSPESLSVDLTNRYIYLVDAGETNERLIRPYRISSSGVLSRIKGNPAAIYGSVSIAFVRPSQ